MNKNNIKELKPGQYWLLEHIITSFWHEFGLSGGLEFYDEEITRRTYQKGTPRKTWVVSQKVMQKKLKNLISWLERYAKDWDDYPEHDCHPENYDQFIKREQVHKSRADILKMLKLIYKMQ
jgi:hypothetical protein